MMEQRISFEHNATDKQSRAFPPTAASRKRLDFALFTLLYNEGKSLRLVGLANGNKGSDKDTYHVALALSCRSPPINSAILY